MLTCNRNPSRAGSAAHTALMTFIATCLITLGSASAMAGGGQSNVAPTNADYQGMSYAQWSAAWAQWVYSLPITHHPLFDTPLTDCSVGQRGNVWFIDGVNDNTTYPPTGRECTIPAGTSLFLALRVAVRDNTNCNGDVIEPTNYTEAQLRQSASDYMDQPYSRNVIIDGVPVNGLLTTDSKGTVITNPNTRFRVQSPVYDITVPSVNSLLDLACYQNLAPEELTVHGLVSDGIYVMIKPLSVGKHMIEFGPFTPPDGKPSRLYNITVTGK